MAGLLASHTRTLPAPCTHHFSALPTLKYTSASLPAARSHQLRGEQGAAARSSWPLRAATCEFCSTCIPMTALTCCWALVCGWRSHATYVVAVEAPTSPPSRTEKLPQTDKYAVVGVHWHHFSLSTRHQ